MKHRRIVVVTALGALAALVAGAGYAAAQPAPDQDTQPQLGQSGFGGPGGPGRGGRQRPALAGEVVKVEDNTITVKTRNGEEKPVRVDDNTRYRKPPEGEATLDDVKAGEKIAIVAGRPAEGEDPVAKAVIIGEPPRDRDRLRDHAGPPVIGEVVAINGDTLTIRTPDGDKQVKLPAITPGSRVGVITGEDGAVKGMLYNPPARPE